MIQFLGIDFSCGSVTAACIGRDLTLTRERSTPIQNVRRDPSGARARVSPAEWVRAASYLTQEIYLDLPVSLRKFWGVGLSSTSGWVALDLDYAPLGDVNLVPADEITAEFRAWIEREPRMEKRISVILSPKDYFRFAVTGSLACDVTLASRQGLLAESDSVSPTWDKQLIADARLEPRWLPPVFDCEVVTGQISPPGIERTGLPGGLRFVAGGLSECCSHVASGDFRSRKLWAPADTGRLLYTVPEPPQVVPAGFQLTRSAYTGHWLLERHVGPDTALGDGIDGAIGDLGAAGLPVEDVVRETRRAALGAAALAAVGSGLIRSWDDFYRKVKW